MYFHPYPQKVDMPSQDDLLVELWNKLDNAVDDLKKLPSFNEDYIRGECFAFSQAIHIVMRPFYPARVDVVKEAMVRWEARQAGTEHESPGLAETIWRPETDWMGHTPTKSEPKTGNLIPDSAIATARVGIDRGLFTVKQMASTYNMTEQEVKEQLGLD
jgi:hypothetical protein